MSNLSTCAMLVNLSISQWGGRKFDKKATKEVADNHNASADEIGRFNKVLVAVSALKTISKLVHEIRSFHYANTLPWSSAGPCILPSANYPFYAEKMRDYKVEFEKRVVEFISNYPAYIEDSKSRLNGLFNPDDYPVDIEHRFNIKVSVLPVPSADDFRVQVGDAETARIKAEIEESVRKTTAVAMKELWARLYDAIGCIHERLSNKDNVFRDSLIGNLSELVDLLPRMNIANDPDLARMAIEAKEKFTKEAPDTLRTNVFVRSKVAVDAKEMMEKMSGFIGKIDIPTV